MKREAVYMMGPESVAEYLEDIEVRWGVKVAISFEMMSYGPGQRLLTLVVTVPHAIHRRELDQVPDITRMVTKAVGHDPWGAAWAALYDFDVALQGNPDSA